MANIYCTKKLEKLIPKNLMASESIADEFQSNWNANLFTMRRRKCLIIVNDVAYYALIFLDVLKKDLLNFQELFQQRLMEQLEYDQINIPPSCSSKLLESCTPNFLPTNNNRKVLGTLNRFVYELEWLFEMDYYGNFAETNLPELNHRLSDNLVGALKTSKYDYRRPMDEMRALLEKVCT